ncbi:MAG TPA: hypothetical protein VFY99_04380 [Solirubrobacterales bacterium]
MRTQARFPSVGPKAGHYESFYIKATRPGGGLGVWIRHTVHKRPGEPATASVWFTVFDADAGGPLATKITVPESELSVPPGGYIRVDGATLSPGAAAGSIATDALSASWDLTFEDANDPFHHLPYDFLYGAPLPKTKFLSPYPDARYSGRVTAGDREIELDGWPGMVGHNWGAEHAERWVWVQGAQLEDEGAGEGEGGPSWFDMAVGRIKIGPWTTPWVGNGMLCLDGERHRLGGFDRARGTKVAEQPTSCDFGLTGKGISVRGRVGSEPRNFVAWVYADPVGPEHNTLNCSISDLELTVERDGRPARRLGVAGAAAYEFGTRETDHGIPVQPYPDG